MITNEGAWCWFADPRALHYDNGKVSRTWAGYIDVHGNIKAAQHDFKTGETAEALIRSWFQPDDHNNPSFLVLPDERVIVFYSRHTDEACFYYRVSQKPLDITALGEEKRLTTANNTTYPSPFILSSDPGRIYLCWRGINWHPTIGRLTLPDAGGNVSFDWGPKQIVQSTGARPYAKYASNGTDAIYMTYTTGHPDNENPNWIYFNKISITGGDASQIKLTDVTGTELSVINNGAHNVNKNASYKNSYPRAVVEDGAYRSWVWEVSMYQDGMPVIAMVRISGDKNQHDYYHARWTGSEWKKTFLANGGRWFHQSNAEQCYSGGMAIDNINPNTIYCSVPVNNVYEIIKYTVNANGSVSQTAVTQNSSKNNVRPYIVRYSAAPGAEPSPLRLMWMNGDYYYWIVSGSYPNGYPTAIVSDYDIYPESISFPRPAAEEADRAGLAANISGSFTVFLKLKMDSGLSGGRFLEAGNVIYGFTRSTMNSKTVLKPYVEINGIRYNSSNIMGNSDNWKNTNSGTAGNWETPYPFKWFTIALTYSGGVLKTYVNGLVDQSIDVNGLSFSEVKAGGFTGETAAFLVFAERLNTAQIKALEGTVNSEQ